MSHGKNEANMTSSDVQGEHHSLIDANRPGFGPRRPYLVLLNGFPGTGKTTVGKQLSQHLHVPFLSKDAFKELIFDALGWSDKEWSLKVSAASHRIMDYLIAEELKVGHSLIIEANFKPKIDSARFRRYQDTYGALLIQILCWAQGDVLFDRYWRRHTSDRHPGHVEAATREEQRRGLAPGKCEPLSIDGTTIEVDTTDFDRVDYAGIFARVTTAMAEP
jgi:predicted kinase